MRKNYLFTSESVSEGHPDKVADQISDALVDAYLKIDPYARLAIETGVTTNKVFVFGEIRVNGKQLSKDEVKQVIRDTVKEIGYEQEGFHWNNLDIDVLLHAQSADIAAGVDSNKEHEGEEGAGDQGLMFGYACNETEDYMPAPIYYSHKILENLLEATKTGNLKGLGPDAKAQVTIKYEDGKPVKAEKVLVSIQHTEDFTLEKVKELVKPYIEETLPKGWMCNDEDLLVNPTGVFIIGGPDGDAGLTGRKIIVDTYGGYAPHGGGAFSGKDCTKVDRSAAYMTRYLAKNIVAAGLADKCTIQVAYAIGVAKPLSLYIDTHGTGKLKDEEIENIIKKHFTLTPRNIRDTLQLHKPIYKKTAAYGHFGRKPEADGSFSWEKLDLVEKFKKEL